MAEWLQVKRRYNQDNVKLSMRILTECIDNCCSWERTENWYCSASYAHVNASVIACNALAGSFFPLFSSGQEEVDYLIKTSLCNCTVQCRVILLQIITYYNEF